jgi:hypothetical protein
MIATASLWKSAGFSGDLAIADAVVVRVAENGRLSVPAGQRKLLGLQDGGLVDRREEAERDGLA